MPDQYKYFEVAQNIRNFDFLNEENFTNGYTVYASGIFFGLFPIPFIESLYSIGMINFLLYLFLFILMHKKGFLKSSITAWFYLLSLDLFLYASLALRDMLVFACMFLGVYFILVAKKYILGFFITSFLFFIKFQNLLIFIISFFVTLFCSKALSKKHLLFGILSFCTMLFLFNDYFTLEKINFYRVAFYNENITKETDPIFFFDSYFDVLISIVSSGWNFLMRPFPWEEVGYFQSIQFLQNCVLGYLIGYIIYENSKYSLWQFREIKFLNFLLIISLIVYGLLIFNSGTAVRYKFPIITVYIIFSLYFIDRFRLRPFNNIQKSKQFRDERCVG